MKERFSLAFSRLVAVVLLVFVAALLACNAKAQTLSVTPVTIVMPPGEMATSLTITNPGERALSFQLRSFTWTQSATGETQLAPADDLIASPPLGTIPPGGGQIIRLVLRHPAQGREATYRLLLDEIPPPAASGTVSIQIRMSIPVLAEPPTHVFPQLQWSVQSDGDQAFLVGVNRGGLHTLARTLSLTTAQGVKLQLQGHGMPYILPGAARRWRIAPRVALPPPGSTLHLVAQITGADTIDRDVPVNAAP
jgi:fimbrial chaperone protein